MAKNVTLLFGIHMHQPVDNFREAVDNAVEKCYMPFFETVERFPFFKFALHCSGWLLEEVRQRHPALFHIIQRLAKEGNIEFFSAGFYEPVLSAIPEKDRVAQIQKLNRTIMDCFGQKPKGLWLTERVWEGSIVSALKRCGIEYAMVDDYHLKTAGIAEEYLDGFFFTEEGGETLSLFPISKKLRYALPFKPVPEAVEAIKECARNEKAAIIFDDAEKFGLWPETYRWVYEKGWLETFLHTLQEDPSITSLHFSEYYAEQRNHGLVYLDNLSYEEMGEWSLSEEDAEAFHAITRHIPDAYAAEKERFLRGASWKHFFLKYEESNRLHKRMLEVSRFQPESETYRDALYRLQTNDVFWHGIFGGLYLPNLRDNAYRYLCECENLRYGNCPKAIEISDTNMDGFEELKVVTNAMITRFDSRYGGQMVEMLLRDRSFNLQNTLTRRKEAYHKELLESSNSPVNDTDKKEGIATIHTRRAEKESRLVDALHVDWYLKNSFIDHISDTTMTLNNFRDCRFKEYGDFADQPFTYSVEEGNILFQRNGGIYMKEKIAAYLEKTYMCEENIISFSINLETEAAPSYLYGLEFNLHFASLDHLFLNEIRADKAISLEDIETFSMRDSYTHKELFWQCDTPFSLLATPLCTVSKSEKGFDLTVQGISFIFLFPFCRKLSISGRLEVYDV